MATEHINFDKVIAYSMKNCYEKSHSLCATYVKRAFEAGGCKYISGDGWNNQNFCRQNGFQLIGDFEPIDHCPRAHKGIPIQFPSGYVQQTGDICLIQHGKYGHICYAMSSDINSWVSDYFQKYPGQQNGTGPYCYQGDVTRVQFWRHSSVMNNAPTVSEYKATSSYSKTDTYVSPQIQNNHNQPKKEVVVNEVSGMSTGKRNNKGIVLGSHMNQK